MAEEPRFSRRVRFFQQLADRGSVNEFEVLWNDGQREHWALLSARRLRYQDQDAVLTASTPIGQIKQMEGRLELCERYRWCQHP